MDDLHPLPVAHLGHVWRTLEAAHAIRHRGELFLWAQGPFQALIPHGLMLGFMVNADQQVVYADLLHAVPVSDAVVKALSITEQGFMARLAQGCHALGMNAIDLPGAPSVTDHPLPGVLADWQRLGLGPALVQGSGPLGKGLASIFVLALLKTPDDPLQRVMLQALLPLLHLALLRSNHFGAVNPVASNAHDAEPGLSERQIEILHWVRLGKTNHEIALILSISELTVKNHLQKVFKKLDVHNRTQAVGKVMAMRLD